MATNKAEKRYKDSPKIEKDEKGKPQVKKAEKEVKTSDETSDQQGMLPHMRHAMERRDMQSRHEAEHAMADHKGMDKKDMHKRHLAEFKAMSARHMGEKK